MMTIKNLINQTFQYPISRKSRWMIPAFIGSFIFLLLSIFQPFHLYNVEIEKRFFVALGYGLIAFVIVFLNHTVASRYLKTHLLLVRGLIVWYILNSVTTAIFSSIYNDIIFNSVLLTFDSFLKFQYFIFVLFLIPSVVLILITRNNRLNNNYLTQIKDNTTVLPQKIVIHAENPSNNFKIETSNLIYIISANNYVDIYYLIDGKVKHTLLRNTLKKVEEDLKEYPNFCRCHKGYIVDLKKVIKISSGVSGLKLRLSEIKDTIPVSRSLAKIIREKLKLFVQ